MILFVTDMSLDLVRYWNWEKYLTYHSASISLLLFETTSEKGFLLSWLKLWWSLLTWRKASGLYNVPLSFVWLQSPLRPDLWKACHLQPWLLLLNCSVGFVVWCQVHSDFLEEVGVCSVRLASPKPHWVSTPSLGSMEELGTGGPRTSCACSLVEN